jgi:hypothetical protein
MRVFRIVCITIAAPYFTAVPYLGFAAYCLTHDAAEGGAPAQGVLALSGLVVVGAGVAVLFLGITRLLVPERNMVRLAYIIAPPIVLSLLFFFVFGLLPLAFARDYRAFIVGLITATASCAAGLAATFAWLRYAYCRAPDLTNRSSQPVTGAYPDFR